MLRCSALEQSAETCVKPTVFSRYPFHEDVGAIIGDFTSVLLLTCYRDQYVLLAELLMFRQNLWMP